MEWRGREWSGGEGRGGKGRAGQGRVPDCLGGLSRVGISSRSTRPWNGQPPSFALCQLGMFCLQCIRFIIQSKAVKEFCTNCQIPHIIQCILSSSFLKLRSCEFLNFTNCQRKQNQMLSLIQRIYIKLTVDVNLSTIQQVYDTCTSISFSGRSCSTGISTSNDSL